MNLEESLLLIRTSRSFSLALMCLYSLYSSAKGERSSFCTFLFDESSSVSFLQNSITHIWFLKFGEAALYLPFCLKNWSSNSRRFFRILFLSSRASWSCSISSCLCVCVKGRKCSEALSTWHNATTNNVGICVWTYLPLFGSFFVCFVLFLLKVIQIRDSFEMYPDRSQDCKFKRS